MLEQRAQPAGSGAAERPADQEGGLNPRTVQADRRIFAVDNQKLRDERRGDEHIEVHVEPVEQPTQPGGNARLPLLRRKLAQDDINGLRALYPTFRDLRITSIATSKANKELSWGSIPQRYAPDSPSIMANGEKRTEEWTTWPKDMKLEKFNAKEWVEIAKSAGMKYMVFTSKHHDGFCLWDTALTEWKITRTPFRRDVLAEPHELRKVLGYLKLWPDHLSLNLPLLPKARLSLEPTPALLGVGYILGFRVSVVYENGRPVEVDTVVLIDNSFIASRWREIKSIRDPNRIIPTRCPCFTVSPSER